MLTLRQKYKSFGGFTEFYEHHSQVTNSKMRFSIYRPEKLLEDAPVLFWLSGLTCTDENFMQKAGAQKYLADLGLVLVAPDTSPRGLGIAGEDDDWFFGSGAGFYVDATEEPWSHNYNMYSYVADELPKIISDAFQTNPKKQSIMGHSMGGHGALVVGLKNSENYRSISAFSPICAASSCDWGRHAFSKYLGSDQKAWKKYDASVILSKQNSILPILLDQGLDDEFLREGQLMTQELQKLEKNHPIQINMREGYDHSFYFISSFIESHLRFHAEYLFL